MLVRLTVSTLLLLVIGSITALPFSHNYIDFLKYISLSILVQIVGYNLYSRYVALKEKDIQVRKLKEYSKQGCEISCPCYQNKKLFIPIRLNQDNSFKCLECKKNVSVQVDVRAFMSTETIDLDKADSALIEAVKKIKSFEE